MAAESRTAVALVGRIQRVGGEVYVVLCFIWTLL
jgi:hypothetical protein